MENSNEMIGQLLQRFRPAFSSDYYKYKNHVYRVFLNYLLIDSAEIDHEKYAIAAVFHDIGIWTSHTIDYLDPSIEQACNYLSETGRQDWAAEITLMINCHHKVSKYHGIHDKIVETFRKADWIDVSFGILNFGIDKQTLKENRKKIPNLGFHLFLIKKIIINLFRHPLHPLSMFKKYGSNILAGRCLGRNFQPKINHLYNSNKKLIGS